VIDVEVIALTGGIGGCKLALGLQGSLRPGALALHRQYGLTNFQHLGLNISPDLDTALYTLSGCNDPVQGWGRRGETWTFMKVLADLGGDTWIRARRRRPRAARRAHAPARRRPKR
jgi:LPPG:FO 2-phospho-L-lactate transferase